MSKVIHIQTESEDKGLSKLQKQFNNYIKKIGTFKTNISNAKECLEMVKIAVFKDFTPLEKEEFNLRTEILQTLDSWFDKGKLSKKEREDLSEYLADECFTLIDTGHEELKPLYEKHADQSYEEAQEAAKAESADMLKGMFEQFGIEFDGEIDMDKPEEMQAKILEIMEQKENEMFEEEQAKPKSKKQLEKEAKKQEAESQLSQSIKEIYKKLVKEFHPDREQDETEKVRKTAIMTRITEAYEKDDLLTLLQLQLEYEQINQENLNLIADEKLKHYNKVLKEQVQMLDQELDMLMGRGFDSSHPFRRLNIYEPDAFMVKYRIDQEIKRLKKLNKDLKKDATNLKLDFSVVKVWIKEIRMAKKNKNLFGNMFDDMF
jgi:hypothetical protein